MQIESDGPLPFEVDDVVETAEAIRRGSIVWFDRIGPHTVVIRVLSPEQLGAFRGKAYRVDRGAEPGAIRLTLLDRTTEN